MTLLRNRVFVLISACFLHATVIGGGYMSLPPLFGQIAAEQSWSLEDLQRAWSFVPLGSALVALVTGFWLRRNGDRQLLLIAGIVSVAGLSLRAFAPSISVFSFALFLFGIGTGSMLVILTNRVSQHFVGRHAGLAQAIFFGAYTAGAAIGLVSAELLSSWLSSWNNVFLLWAALSLVALIPGFLQNSMAREEIENRNSNDGWIRKVLPFTLVYGSYVGGYLGVVGLFPHQLRQWAWPATAADGALAGSTLAFVAGAAFWAYLTDRFGFRRFVFVAGMAGCSVLTISTVVSAPLGQNFLAISAIILTGFFGGVMALFIPIMLEGRATGAANASKSIGSTTAASYVGGFLLPFVMAPYSATNPELALVVFSLSFSAAGVFMALSDRDSQGAPDES